MIIKDFNPEQFLQDYWQKKPCLIKQFSPNFIDPVDENDLAGLAQEPGVDSRIVSSLKGEWNVKQGPFDDFAPYCKGDWALLVQGVNNYIDEVDELSQLVDFIPHWRFDDVMVSYSTENAGVGAHTDQYDVFIIQGKGSRRWQVGLPLDTENVLVPHPLLKQIEDFEPVIDAVLQPGDAIYIPPKHPHKGTTLSPCLNYSLGFRAPTSLETLNGLLDESDAIEQSQTRYTDADITQLRSVADSPQLVTTQELNKLKDAMRDLLNTSTAQKSLLQFLSRQSLPAREYLPVYTVADISQHLVHKDVFTKMPGVKPIYGEKSQNNFVFYIDGNPFETPSSMREHVITLLSNNSVDCLPESLTPNSSEATHWLDLLTQLVNAGYWDCEADD